MNKTPFGKFNKFHKEDATKINERIDAKSVRLIDEEGKPLGVLDKEKAQELAFERGLDLVQISNGVEPPVCKIIDYNKYRYNKEKKIKENKKKQKVVHLKEIKIRPKISSHDLEIKERYIQRFLDEKNKVKVTVIFRGRELNNMDLGTKIIEELKEKFLQVATMEKDVEKYGRNLQIIFIPKK